MPPSHMSVDIFAQSIVRLGETLSVDTTDLRALLGSGRGGREKRERGGVRRSRGGGEVQGVR